MIEKWGIRYSSLGGCCWGAWALFLGFRVVSDPGFCSNRLLTNWKIRSQWRLVHSLRFWHFSPWRCKTRNAPSSKKRNNGSLIFGAGGVSQPVSSTESAASCGSKLWSQPTFVCSLRLELNHLPQGEVIVIKKKVRLRPLQWCFRIFCWPVSGLFQTCFRPSDIYTYTQSDWVINQLITGRPLAQLNKIPFGEYQLMLRHLVQPLGIAWCGVLHRMWPNKRGLLSEELVLQPPKRIKQIE